jgi:hypothetical protein
VRVFVVWWKAAKLFLISVVRRDWMRAVARVREMVRWMRGRMEDSDGDIFAISD